METTSFSPSRSLKACPLLQANLAQFALYMGLDPSECRCKGSLPLVYNIRDRFWRKASKGEGLCLEREEKSVFGKGYRKGTRQPDKPILPQMSELVDIRILLHLLPTVQWIDLPEEEHALLQSSAYTNRWSPSSNAPRARLLISVEAMKTHAYASGGRTHPLLFDRWESVDLYGKPEDQLVGA